MPVDAGLYGQFAPQVRQPQDYTNALMQQDAMRQSQALNALNLQKQQADMADTAALREAYRAGADPSTAEGRAKLIQAAPLQAPAIFKQNADLAKTQAETQKFGAQAGEATAKTGQLTLETAQQKTSALAQRVTTLKGPGDVFGFYQQGVNDGLITPQAAMQEMSQIPQDPQGFETWKAQQQQKGLKLADQIGNQIKAQEEAGRNTRAAATNQTHLQGIAAQQSGENSRAALGRQTQLTIAGLNPDGSVNKNVESMAQAIAKGDIAPLSGFALARPAGQQVMARVMQINPQYDATTYGAKADAAKKFTGGQQGNSLRSFAVAGQHLDQLGQLADALQNGNVQIINKIGNTIAEQTGSPAPTNFDAAKDVVSKEVVKAIVAGGGGVGERQELKDLMDKAKSPAQLKGVITQYRNLMSAQHDALLEQRRAAGLPDSTLPNYTPPASPAAAPSGGPKVGSVEGGYRFKGGNPADQKSWERM